MNKNLLNANNPNIGSINFKNRIINGDFQVNHRNNSLISNDSDYAVDRVFVDAVNSEIVVTDEIIYSLNEGSLVTNTDPFGDSSQVNLYHFDSNSNDANGNNNGTDTKVDYVSGGKWGNCLFTDQDNTSHVELNGIPKIFDETDKTFSCWVANIASCNISSIINTSTDSNKNNSRCSLDVSKLWIYNGTNINYNYPNDDLWHHYSFTVSSKGTKVYIDGKLVAQDYRTIINDSGTASYDAYCICNNWYNITNNIGTPNLKIDQVRIFNKALTDDEVRKLYVEDLNYINKKHLKVEINSKGTSATINPYVYKFEGQHIADIIKEPISLSFDFFSNKTGSYNVKLVTECLDGTQETFDTTFTYTGSNFERIEISILKETFTKDIINDERLGATLYIAPNAENNVDVGDFIRLTNIQLEKGNVSTEFEILPYEKQLERCMRYYDTIDESLLTIIKLNSKGNFGGTNKPSIKFIPKRIIPTVKVLKYSNSNGHNWDGSLIIIKDSISVWTNNLSADTEWCEITVSLDAEL